MEMKGTHVLIAFVIALAVCVLAVYSTVPEYIHLEDTDKANYEAQIDACWNTYDNKQIEWQEFADDCNAYGTTIREDEKHICSLEKKEMTQRLSENNYELIEMNKEYQDIIKDLNKAIVDLNRTITDFNINDLNCWR